MHDGQDNCQERSEPQNPGLGQRLKVKIVPPVFLQLFDEAHAVAVGYRIVVGEMSWTHAQNWIVEENVPRRHVQGVAPNDRRVRYPRLTLGGLFITGGCISNEGIRSSPAFPTEP